MLDYTVREAGRSCDRMGNWQTDRGTAPGLHVGVLPMTTASRGPDGHPRRTEARAKSCAGDPIDRPGTGPKPAHPCK